VRELASAIGNLLEIEVLWVLLAVRYGEAQRLNLLGANPLSANGFVIDYPLVREC